MKRGEMLLTLIMTALLSKEKVTNGNVCFLTPACCPITGALGSEAANFPAIMLELIAANSSEQLETLAQAFDFLPLLIFIVITVGRSIKIGSKFE